MELEIIILREISHTERDISHVLSQIQSPHLKKKNDMSVKLVDCLRVGTSGEGRFQGEGEEGVNTI
jgi:hypothetical protein